MKGDVTMDTNFQMLRSFKYEPESFGFCTPEEVRQIKDHFKIKERSDVELQNLRDFVVMYYDHLEDKLMADDKYTHDEYRRLYDTMSAVTGVIDNEKYHRGMEV